MSMTKEAFPMLLVTALSCIYIHTEGYYTEGYYIPSLALNSKYKKKKNFSQFISITKEALAGWVRLLFAASHRSTAFRSPREKGPRRTVLRCVELKSIGGVGAGNC